MVGTIIKLRYTTLTVCETISIWTNTFRYLFNHIDIHDLVNIYILLSMKSLDIIFDYQQRIQVSIVRRLEIRELSTIMARVGSKYPPLESRGQVEIGGEL